MCRPSLIQRLHYAFRISRFTFTDCRERGHVSLSLAVYGSADCSPYTNLGTSRFHDVLEGRREVKEKGSEGYRIPQACIVKDLTFVNPVLIGVDMHTP